MNREGLNIAQQILIWIAGLLVDAADQKWLMASDSPNRLMHKVYGFDCWVDY